MSHTLNESGGL